MTSATPPSAIPPPDSGSAPGAGSGAGTGSEPSSGAEAGDARSALLMVTSLQTAHQAADAKAGALAAVQAGLVAAAASRADGIGRLWERGGATAWIGAFLLVVFVTGFLVSVTCLALALRPRTQPPIPPNRFSVPLLAAGDGSPPSSGPALEREEGWRLAHVLAGVAMAKHRHIGRAVVWTCVTAAVAGVFLIATPFLGL